MSGKFAPFLSPDEDEFISGNGLFSEEMGISAAKAGMSDAKEAMAAARQILRDAAAELKQNKVA